MKAKHNDPQFKGCLTQVKDVNESGVITFYASVFNTVDRVGDIVEKGAYKKTIKENFKQIQHYKNHYSDEMVGVVQELKEDDYGLLVVSKLILDTQQGKETYAQYKAMAEADKSMSHSIGYYPVKVEDNPDEDFVKLKEILLFEVSTLTKRPAHPDATTVGIKSIDDLLKESKYYEALLKSDLPEIELEQLENIKNHIDALIANRAAKSTPANNEPQFTSEEINTIFKF